MKVDLTEESMEDIIELLKYLLKSGVYGSFEVNISKSNHEKNSKTEILDTKTSRGISKKYQPAILKIPGPMEGLQGGKPYISDRTKSIGSWGMFNTFNSGKATLRVLANLMKEENKQAISITTITDKSMKAFFEYGLSKFRGFPNKDEPSARGRLVSHFISTMFEMGFIVIKESKIELNNLAYVPPDQWDFTYLSITKEGLAFARLKNNLLDNGKLEQNLTDEEVRWILNWLKNKDNEGYREFSFLKSLYDYLKKEKRKKDDILAWFKEYKPFENYWRSESRKLKRGDEEGYKKQMENLSTTFMSSKIALLRELGLVSQKRNDYRVVGEWI